MAQVVFSWLFGVLIYFFSTNSLLSQLQQPALIHPSSDNTFWLLHLLRIPQLFLSSGPAALVFDILLTSSCLVCIFVPRQRLFTIITVAGSWLLYVCYCSAAGKHYAQLGYLLAPLPFLALSQERFSLAWEGLRYWICFLYAAAGIYKFYYAGVFDPGNMHNILSIMNAEWLVFQPGGFHRDVITYLIDHPVLSQWLYRGGALLELSLIVGFFTKKLDTALLAFLLAFHLGNFFLLHISFVEQSLIFAPFLPWKRWAHYFN